MFVNNYGFEHKLVNTYLDRKSMLLLVTWFKNNVYPVKLDQHYSYNFLY